MNPLSCALEGQSSVIVVFLGYLLVLIFYFFCHYVKKHQDQATKQARLRARCEAVYRLKITEAISKRLSAAILDESLSKENL